MMPSPGEEMLVQLIFQQCKIYNVVSCISTCLIILPCSTSQIKTFERVQDDSSTKHIFCHTKFLKVQF